MTRCTKFLIFFFIVVFASCTTKKAKSNIEVLFTQDTLDVGYTYWWPKSGPFIGQCGEELSLVFEGTVIALKEPNNDPGPLYTSKEGVIELTKVYKIKDVGENTYAGQKFFVSDCFFESNIAAGDQVLVICYDYEGAYSIPGKQSILKIASFDDPLVESIRTYIDTDQNALALKEDVGIWAKKNLGRQLQSVIKCKEEMKSGSSPDSKDNK